MHRKRILLATALLLTLTGCGARYHRMLTSMDDLRTTAHQTMAEAAARKARERRARPGADYTPDR